MKNNDVQISNEELIARLHKWIWKWIIRSACPESYRNDLYADIVITILTKRHMYNDQYSITTYFTYWIRYTIQAFMRKLPIVTKPQHSNVVSLSYPLPSDNFDVCKNVEGQDIYSNREKFVTPIHDYDDFQTRASGRIKQAMKKLTSAQRLVVINLFGFYGKSPISQELLGKKYNMGSRQNVSLHLNKAFKVLRGELRDCRRFI